MTQRSPRQQIHARLAGVQRDRDEGVAMVFSILLIVIVAGLSIALTAVLINQVKPALLSRKGARTINASAAGLQVALTQLRSSTDSSGTGLLTAIPCQSATAATFKQGATSVSTQGAKFDGSVSNGPGSVQYSVSVAYYLSNPATHPDDLTWLHDNAMTCPLAAVPYYAFVQSYGTGADVAGTPTGRGDRSEQATYEFGTTNVNVTGGRIFEYGTQVCLDAGATPAVGSTMTMESCLAIGTPSQTWQYRNDLTIFYGGDPSLNLCIQAPSSGTTVTLRTCTGTGTGSTYPYGSTNQQLQEFGFNDNGHFATAKSDGTVNNGAGPSCLQPSGANDSTPAAISAALVFVDCNSGTTGYTAWDPDPQVGAGKAGGNTTGLPGALTYQYVNYQEFGRCLDITGQNVNADHLIDYPCKQAPDSSTLTWNQVWLYQPVSGGYGTMSVNYSGTRYCLEAPVATGTLIVTKPCASTPGANQLWQATGALSGNYVGSYLLVSKLRTMCMSVTSTGAITFGSSNVIVETCDGSLKQKWNAPPTAPNTGLGNISETRS